MTDPPPTSNDPRDDTGTVTRRAVLRAGVVGIGAALAGCSSGETDELCGTDSPATDGATAIDEREGTLPVAPDTAWPMSGYDPAQSGHNPDATLPEEPALRWHFETREPPERESRRRLTPVVADRTVYLVNAHGELVAVDAQEGAVRWRVSDPRLRTESVSAVGSESVFVAGEAGLFAVDFDGEERWRYAPRGVVGPETPTPTTPPPTPDGETPPPDGEPRIAGFWDPLVDGDTVYVAERSADGVHAVDAATGTERWTAPGYDLAAVAGELVLATDGGLVALDADDGSEVWRADPTTYGSVAVRDGAVYAGELEHFYRLNLATGETEWSFDGEIESFESPAVGPDRVYAPTSVTEGGDGGNLYALDRETGEPEWCRYLGFTTVGPPALADGRVHAATDEGDLWALDVVDGSVTWSFSRQYGFFESVAAVDGGVFVGGRGEVWAIG